MKRILSLFFVIIITLGMIPFGVSAADGGLEEEIQNTTIGGELFNEKNYPAVSGAAAKIFGFSEVGYTYSGDFSKFGMYVYVYNPSQKAVKTDGAHQIMMAVKFDDDGNALEWEEFDMIFVKKTDNNRFLKFKVTDHNSTVDGKKIVTRVDRDARRYSVAELEIHYDGMIKATSVSVGQSYVFTGFAADNTLSLHVCEFETLELDVKPTIFRSVSSSKGEEYQNQLNSVYFSVPNRVMDEYGYLAAIRASWNEQKTQPIVVCDNLDAVCALNGFSTTVGPMQNWIGVDIGQYSENVPYGFCEPVLNGSYVSYDILYNYKTSRSEYNRIKVLAYMFYDNEIVDGETNVTAEDLIKHIEKYEYGDFLFADKVDSGRTKGQQTVDVRIGETFNFENFSGVRDWFVNIWNSISGGDVLQKTFEDIAPIYQVTASDMAITDKDKLAQRLLVDVNDVDAIREAYNTALINDESLWLFRFAATDYYAHDIAEWYYQGDLMTDTNGYWAEQTVFLDFNVISLTCEKEGVATVIPVSSNKQDIAGDVSAPTPGVTSDVDPWAWIQKILGILFVFVLGVTLLPLLVDSIRWIFPKKRE